MPACVATSRVLSAPALPPHTHRCNYENYGLPRQGMRARVAVDAGLGVNPASSCADNGSSGLVSVPPPHCPPRVAQGVVRARPLFPVSSAGRRGQRFRCNRGGGLRVDALIIGGPAGAQTSALLRPASSGHAPRVPRGQRATSLTGHGRRSRQEGTGRTPGTTSGATAPLGGSLGPRGSQNARGTNCGATGPRGPVAGDPQRAERRCHRPRALRISSGGGRGRAGNMNSPSPAMPTGSFF